MRLIVEIAGGKSAGRKTALREASALNIGRTDDADFVVADDLQLSRTHFRLSVKAGVCLVNDLSSSNGTYVNEQRISEQVLQDGDSIRAGQTTFRVRIEGVGAAPQPAAIPQLPVAAPAVAAQPPPPAVSKASPRPARRAGPSFELGWSDPDAGVRRAALLAAVYWRQPALADHCRRLAATPSPDRMDEAWLLAVLGGPQDLPLLLRIGATKALGAARFRPHGSFGHPGVVPQLLETMASPDIRDAVAAVAAYLAITGHDVGVGPRVPVPPPDGESADAVEQEFLPEAQLPDPAAARRHWHAVRDRFQQGVRWRQGFDLSAGVGQGFLDALYLPARWEATLREHYAGNRPCFPQDVFPAWPKSASGNLS